MYSLHDNASSRSRFPSCLVNEEDHLVSLEQQTNFDFRIGRSSCSRSPLAIYETPRATGSPDPSDVSLFFFCQNVGIDCRNLTTMLNFFCARIHLINISSLLVLGTFTSMPALPSLMKTCISLIGPSLAEHSSVVSCNPDLKDFSNLPDFCVICNFTVEQVLCSSSRSLFRHLPVLFVDSETA